MTVPEPVSPSIMILALIAFVTDGAAQNDMV